MRVRPVSRRTAASRSFMVDRTRAFDGLVIVSVVVID